MMPQILGVHNGKGKLTSAKKVLLIKNLSQSHINLLSIWWSLYGLCLTRGVKINSEYIKVCLKVMCHKTDNRSEWFRVASDNISCHTFFLVHHALLDLKINHILFVHIHHICLIFHPMTQMWSRSRL